MTVRWILKGEMYTTDHAELAQEQCDDRHQVANGHWLVGQGAYRITLCALVIT